MVLPLSGRRAACRAAACAAALLCSLAPAAADTGLATALQQAWRLHPQAAALDARDAQARAARDGAAAWTPEPGAVSLGARSDRLNRHAGSNEFEAEFSTPLWLPGQQAARADEAERRIDEAAARRAALRWELAGELRQAWWTLAAARSADALAARRLRTARLLEADVRRRFVVGELSRIDANLALAEVHQAEGEQTETQAVRLQAEQALRLLTGSAARAPLGEEALASAAAAGDGAPNRAQSPPPVSDAHPLLAAAAAVERSARARLAVVERSSRSSPELALRLVRERGDFAEPYAHSIGVRLTIPLSSPAHLRRDGAEARAEAEQALAETERARRRIALDLEQAQAALRAAEHQIRNAAQRLELAADNLGLAEKAFRLGEADLATLLRMRAAHFDAESVADRQRVARAAAVSRMNQAIGALP